MKELSIAPELIYGNQVQRKALLFYSFASTLYKNPIILNYTPEKLSKKTGLSTVTIRKYIGVLIKLGHAEKRGNHLVFISKKKLVYEIKKVKFLWIRRTWNFYKFLDNYYTATIERNIEQQEFVINGRTANPNDFYQMKMYKRFKKRFSSKYVRIAKNTINDEVFLSSRSLAKVFGISQSTTNNVLNRLDKRGLIKQSFRFKEISYCEHKFIKDNTNLYSFKYNDKFFLHKGRNITISGNVKVDK